MGKKRTIIPEESIKDSKFWKPDFNIAIDKTIKTDSWFDHNTAVEYDRIFNLKTCTNINNNEYITANKIYIYPTKKQRSILLEWIETCRRIYNCTLKYVREHPKCTVSLPKLRPLIKAEIDKHDDLKRRCARVPLDVKDGAIRDFIDARKVAFANYTAGNIKRFRMRYKKDVKQFGSIRFNEDAFQSDDRLYSRILQRLGVGSVFKCEKNKTLSDINIESKLCYNAQKDEFCFKVPVEHKNINVITEKELICAIDPGIRTFLTVYTPGNAMEIGTDKTLIKIDNLIKRIHRKPEYDRYFSGRNDNISKHYERLRNKLKNIVKDLHYKTANYLCRNFETIIIGDMSTQGIVQTKLNDRTKDKIHALSHYTFRQILISKAQQYNCKIIVQDESYTSKTCGGCGQIHHDLGANKIFKCPICNYVADRDLNASRNILIKAAALSYSALSERNRQLYQQSVFYIKDTRFQYVYSF